MLLGAKFHRVSLAVSACALLIPLALPTPSHAEEFRVTDAPIDTSNFDGFALLGDDLYYGVRIEEQDRSQLIHVERDTGAWRVVAEVADDKAPLHIREVAVLGDAVYFVSAPLLKYFGTLWKFVPATGALEALRQFDTLAPRELEVVGDKLILAAWATSKERSGIWRSDGTAAGTVQLGTGFVPENLTTAEPYVYFTSLGTDLYRIGVNGGALKISSGINFRDSVNRRILKVALFNFRIYFFASNSATEMLELWSTDGSQRNTRQESFIAEKGALPKATPKSSPPLEGGGAAGAEPPFLGIIDDSLVFSVPDYPFFYFYRYNLDAPDGSNASLITETPITFLLPFDKGLILAGPVEVDRREVLFVGNGTISDINANLALGLVPGPLLSNRASAYFVDVSAVQTGGDPATFEFPLYRIRSGTGIPTRVDTGEALAGKILGAAAAVSDTAAYVYLLDPTGQEAVKLTQIIFTDDPAEGEGEPEGATEGVTEGEVVDPEVLRDLAQRILNAFAVLDEDRDGILSTEEVAVSGITLTPPQFESLDADASNTLSQEELVAAGAVAPLPGCGCLRDGTFTDWRMLLGDFVTAAFSVVTLLMVSVLLKKS